MVTVQMRLSRSANWLSSEFYVRGGGEEVDNHATITSVTVSPRITTLPCMTFCHFAALRKVVLPPDVRRIRTQCFQGCKQLAEINLEHVWVIESQAFDGCAQLERAVLTRATLLGDQAFQFCVKLETVAFGNELTDVGRECFRWCEELWAVAMPASAERIGVGAFYSCSNLASFTGSRITEISSEMFAWCTSIKACDIPDSVTTIGQLAFAACNRLTELRIPSLVEHIDNGAFEDCSRLRLLAIPLTDVGRGAFAGCAMKVLEAPRAFEVTPEHFRRRGGSEGVVPPGIWLTQSTRLTWSTKLHCSKGKDVLPRRIKTWIMTLLLVGARARLCHRPGQKMPCVSNDAWLRMLTYITVADI